MGRYGHLTLQIGEYNIDVPFTHKGLTIARDFIDLVGDLLREDQASRETGSEK